MADASPELIETYRAEAIALFNANQDGRRAGQRIAATIFGAVAVAVIAGIQTGNDDVAIPLAPMVLILLSAMCQQYGDVTVLGAARAQLERRLADVLGEHALIYETAVAPIRKQPPLVASVRALQALAIVLVVAAVAVGTVVAFDQQPARVSVGYVVFTTAAAASAVLSYRAMRRSWSVAEAEVKRALPAARG